MLGQQRIGEHGSGCPVSDILAEKLQQQCAVVRIGQGILVVSVEHLDIPEAKMALQVAVQIAPDLLPGVFLRQIDPGSSHLSVAPSSILPIRRV